MLTPCLIENREAALHERLDTLASFNRHVAHDLRGPLVSMAAAAERAQQSLNSGDTEAALRMPKFLTSAATSAPSRQPMGSPESYCTSTGV